MALMCGGVAAGVPARAAEVSSVIEVGVGHSDNIARTPDQEIDESMGLIGLDLLLRHDSRRLTADVVADVSYVDYLDDTFDSEVLGNAAANVQLGIVPERFIWVIEDSFGQIRSDIFAAPTPRNREDVNVLSTGPDFLTRLGNRNLMRLSGRYGRTDYEESLLDQESVGGTLSFIRELSGASSVSLNGEVTSYEYSESTAFSDYDRRSVYLGYEMQGARTTLSAQLGYTMVDFGAQDSDGLLVRLDLTRRVSSTSALSFGIGSSFSDAGDAFRQAQRLRPGRNDTQPTIATADAFRRDFVNVGWEWERHRTNLGLTAGYTSESYERQPELDREYYTAGAHIGRQLGRSVNVNLNARFEREKFDNGFDDDTLRVGAEWYWEAGRHVVFALRGYHYDRTSSDATTEYDENQAWLTVGYRMGQQR
jgi:hypothetical protein